MYNHFAERLKERYGLEITPLEYIDLIAAKFRLISRDIGTGRSRGIVEFKGQKINVVKQSNKNKFLITALPKNIYIKPKT